MQNDNFGNNCRSALRESGFEAEDKKQHIIKPRWTIKKQSILEYY